MLIYLRFDSQFTFSILLYISFWSGWCYRQRIHCHKRHLMSLLLFQEGQLHLCQWWLIIWGLGATYRVHVSCGYLWEVCLRHSCIISVFEGFQELLHKRQRGQRHQRGMSSCNDRIYRQGLQSRLLFRMHNLILELLEAQFSSRWTEYPQS